MLFRTVYGPELEAIYSFVRERNAQSIHPNRQDVHLAFIPRRPDGSFPPTQNVDDALAFLKSARMIAEESDGFHLSTKSDNSPFAVGVLQAMRRIENGVETPDHPIDPLYTLLLTELFIKPDCLYVQDVYGEANQLRAVQAAGGLSREKVQAWKRVMEFLEVGRRVAGGFLCGYSPALIEAVLGQWDNNRGVLQPFFESHFTKTLPCLRADGDLAQAVRAPLAYLAEQGQIELFPLQDSPTRPYFGPKRYRGIARRNSDE